jgi:hypothetical protein
MQPATAQWVGIAISGALGASALLWNVFKHLSDRRQVERQRLLERAEVIEIKDWSFITNVNRGVCASLTIRNCGIPDVYIESVPTHLQTISASGRDYPAMGRNRDSA